MNVTISGAGKYGSALAFSVQEKSDRKITFLARNQKTVDTINNERKTVGIAAEDVNWKENVKATTNAEEA